MKQARKHNLAAENLRFAKRFTSDSLTPLLAQQLRELTSRFSLSLKFGDLILLNGGWYVTHAGLIRLAERSNCSGMQVHPVRHLSDPTSGRFVFPGHCLQIIALSRVCGLRRRRPLQCLSSSPRCRDASCRNSRCQPRSAQSLRNRHLLRRGDWGSEGIVFILTPNRSSFRRSLLTGTTAGGPSAIASANLFVSINSTQLWSSRTLPTFAASKHFAKQRATKWKAS
jgi:hypothetical protein